MVHEITVTSNTGETTRQRVGSTQFEVGLDTDDDDTLEFFAPAAVTEVEKEKSGETPTVSDQCGRTERKHTVDKGWVIRVRGIVTGNNNREGNLSQHKLSNFVAASDDIYVQADIFDGTIAVSNVVVTQSNDIVSIRTPDTDGEEAAYEFQLQLGEEDSEQ